MTDKTASENASWIIAHPEDFTEMELHLARGIEQLQRDIELSVCYSPSAIRDSFDGADEDHPDAQWVEQASDEELLAVSYMIVGSDPVWRDFHRNIESCIEEVRMRKE